MTTRREIAWALHKLANKVEEAMVLEYGYVGLPLQPRQRGRLKQMNRQMQPEHIEELLLVLDLRQAALDCTEEIIERERAIVLLERALALKAVASDIQFSEAVIEFSRAYKQRHAVRPMRVQ